VNVCCTLGLKKWGKIKNRGSTCSPGCLYVCMMCNHCFWLHGQQPTPCEAAHHTDGQHRMCIALVHMTIIKHAFWPTAEDPVHSLTRLKRQSSFDCEKLGPRSSAQHRYLPALLRTGVPVILPGSQTMLCKRADCTIHL